MDESVQPLFKQVAALIEDTIVAGDLLPGEQAPSTTQLAQFHTINPATARKGLSILVDEGVLVKKRGLGMFVTEDAPMIIKKRRRAEFVEAFVVPLLREAETLGITVAEVIDQVTSVDSRALALAPVPGTQ